MSILIKDMEMPKGIEMLVVFSDGTVHKCLPGMREYIEKGIAIPIPPHGDLIDRDAMIRDIQKSIAPSWYIKERNADMVKFLSLEDTIIPASEEGE